MQIGQVPVMFAPEAPVVDTTAVTAPADTELQPMFPEQFEAEVVTADAPGLFGDIRVWSVVGLALVVWWAMSPGRR